MRADEDVKEQRQEERRRNEGKGDQTVGKVSVSTSTTGSLCWRLNLTGLGASKTSFISSMVRPEQGFEVDVSEQQTF